MDGINDAHKSQKIKEEAGELSIHGLPKLIKMRSFSKRLFWLVCCCSAFAFFVYFTVSILKLHYSRETYWSTKMKFSNHLKLPAVTICNTDGQDAFNRKSGDVIFQHFPKSCSDFNHSELLTPKNREYFEGACKTFMSMSERKTMRKGHEYIKFPDNFTFVPNFWPCFTLNRNATLEQYEASERDGIIALLFYNESNRVRWPHFPDIHLSDERQGLYVDIHDSAEHIHKFQGTILPTGFHTHIAIRKTKVTRMKHPFASDCYNDNENGYTKIIPGKHSVSNCMLSCLGIEMYKKCQDVFPSMRQFMDDTTYPKRTNKTFQEVAPCLDNAMKRFTSAKNQAEKCNCRLPCEQTYYETRVTQNPWPKSWQVAHLTQILSDVTKIPKEQIGLELIKKYMIKVSIYYDDPTETEITEKELYETAKIVSDLGGQMGMFMGASFLSLVELLVLTYKLISDWCIGTNHIEPKQTQDRDEETPKTESTNKEGRIWSIN